MIKEEEKIKYPVYRFRMSKKTYDLLLKRKKKLGKSWNLTFYDLIINKYKNDVSLQEVPRE